jgi:hypothetical protein
MSNLPGAMAGFAVSSVTSIPVDKLFINPREPRKKLGLPSARYGGLFATFSRLLVGRVRELY